MPFLQYQCQKCGKVLHLDEKASDELLYAVKTLSDFSVSEEDTVLFGKCANCTERGKK